MKLPSLSVNSGSIRYVNMESKAIKMHYMSWPLHPGSIFVFHFLKYLSSIFTNICLPFSQLFVFHFQDYLSSIITNICLYFLNNLSLIFSFFSFFLKYLSSIFAMICLSFSQIIVYNFHNHLIPFCTFI